MNTATKPLLRGHFHQAAFFFVLGACAMLFTRAHGTTAIIATTIYSLALAGLFGISALYHRPNWKPAGRLWMRRLDHAAIYIQIAGTSTPICLLALPHDVGINLLRLVWIAAAFGITQSLFWINAPKWLQAIFYVVMGLLVVPYMREFQSALSTNDIWLIVCGGIVYIAGAVIYALKKPNPWPAIFGYHEIFHLLVIVGAFLHFVVVSSLIGT